MYKLSVILLIALAFFVASSMPVHADYPGAALFRYQCNTNGIAFFYKENSLFQVRLAQVYGPLSVAVATQQNQPIVLSDPASLWALKSNEFQIHLNADPDGTKLVLNTGICGQISAQPLAVFGQALAYVRLTGMGQGIAFARVTASGQVLVYAQVSGTGFAFAAAQSSGIVPPVSGPQSGDHIYVVQPGDTLFSIARRYNISVSVLVRLNNLFDPNLIVVGQSIRLQ
jgi:hypothetical protein